MRGNRSVLVGCALLLSGCTMIPRYERPAPPVPETFPGAAASGPGAAEVPWRDFVGDVRLRAAIERALAANRDLRVAALRVEAAEALYRIQRSELTPGIGARASGERVRVPGSMTESGSAEVQESWAVNVGFVSWELDLFGRIRSLKAAALEDYLATDETRRAVTTSLVAAVAGEYLTLAADLENLRLAEETVAAQRSFLDLIRASAEGGIASDLDLRQAESQVEAARVAVAAYAGAVARDRNALGEILGGPFPTELEPTSLADVAETREVGAGLPSEVLLARPDILAAEHRLRAANADIGAARAAFFPRISLTAAAGTMSPDLSGLFSAGSRSWTFAPQADTAIFAGGLQLARLKAAKVEREIAVAQYERAIQAAFREVADALALAGSLVEQRDAQAALVRSLEETYRLSEARYRAGIDGYLGVLVAQRSLLAARQGLVDVRLAERANRVTLYRALGGGVEEEKAWESASVSSETTTPR